MLHHYPIGAGGIFLETNPNLSTIQTDSTNPSSPNHSIAYSQNIQFFSEQQQVTQLITHHLDEVLDVMNQLNLDKETADFRDPTWKGAASEFTWLPTYMIKLGGSERVNGGEALKKCVAKNGSNLIVIPEQRCFYIPETHHQKTNLRELCVAKKIEGIQGREIKINLQQARQLVTLIIETGISDLKWRNLVYCNDGTIALIDTECFLGAYYGLRSLLEKNSFDDDARKFVVEEIDAMRLRKMQKKSQMVF
ncbi:MAG: hypothetical protein JSS53_07435 [Proteobacteria bacterium]|nr:hypothetical protein [Pseudomonadota bacterium]